MRPGGARLELGMELAADVPGVVGQLDHLDESPVRGLARQAQPVLRQHVTEGIVDLPAVAVPLAALAARVGLRRARAGTQPRRVLATAHRAAEIREIALRLHEGDDRGLALGRELRAVALREPADVAGELDDRHLQAKTDAEERQIVLPRPAHRVDHALDAALPEPAR